MLSHTRHTYCLKIAITNGEVFIQAAREWWGCLFWAGRLGPPTSLIPLSRAASALRRQQPRTSLPRRLFCLTIGGLETRAVELVVSLGTAFLEHMGLCAHSGACGGAPHLVRGSPIPSASVCTVHAGCIGVAAVIDDASRLSLFSEVVQQKKLNLWLRQ
jgi:hypothetical protein